MSIRLRKGMIPCSVERHFCAWLVRFDNGATLLLQTDYDQVDFAVNSGKLRAPRDWNGNPSSIKHWPDFNPTTIDQCPDDYLNLLGDD